MLRQYSPQRFRYLQIGDRLEQVGTVPIGTIFRSSPDSRRGWDRKLMVEAWLPREIGAAAMVNGKYVNRFAARGGHLAIVRDLANGSRFELADHYIRFCVDHS